MFTVKPKEQLFDSTQAIVIGLYHENRHQQKVYQEINSALGEVLDEYVKHGDLSNDYKAVTKVYTLGRIEPKRIYVLGLGKKKELTRSSYIKAIGHLAKELKKDRITQFSFVLDSFVSDQFSEEEVSALFAEATLTAIYDFPNYKTNNSKPPFGFESISVITDKPIQKALDEGHAYADGINTARYLVQLPGNLLTATDLAHFAEHLAHDLGLGIEILEKEDLERLGMGALLAVNQGSVEPPKMIVLKYQGKGKWEDVLGLVGKGITFDTGGYSLKSKEGIVGMKSDMGGAASVLGAMEIIGRLKPKENVVAVIPSTDNMISGSAFKPDDVITSFSGKTIEVLNTDAEGRLALADAITYAKHHGASRLIDVATLTGGVIVALGDWITGAMTNDQEYYQSFEEITKWTDEPIWQLPYLPVYQEKVRGSELADLNNSPGRKAHPIMAGSFLAEFAENTPWIHLDIAGTSTSDKEYDLGPKGPTGVMVKSLAAYILKGQK
ncbi:leucyl aminopeptidase [Bacillaceae bacterium S4-13-58]